MRELKGKVALVTGAGSGIGRETALALAREGARLIVCDVNEASLRGVEQELGTLSECLLARRVDVSDEHAMKSFSDEVHSKVPAVDILINNAGVGLAGNIIHTTLDDWKWIIGINLWGVIHGCHFFTPKMVERGQGGHVVNVSSMLGFFASPDIVGYTTAKFGVFGLSMCLREDLAGHGIGVSVICPGMINTNIVSTARVRAAVDTTELQRKVIASYQRRNYGPERVAAAVVNAIKRNRAILPVSPESWLGYYVNRVWPAGARAMGRKLHSMIQSG